MGAEGVPGGYAGGMGAGDGSDTPRVSLARGVGVGRSTQRVNAPHTGLMDYDRSYIKR